MNKKLLRSIYCSVVILVYQNISQINGYQTGGERCNGNTYGNYQNYAYMGMPYIHCNRVNQNGTRTGSLAEEMHHTWCDNTPYATRRPSREQTRNAITHTYVNNTVHMGANTFYGNWGRTPRINYGAGVYPYGGVAIRYYGF